MILNKQGFIYLILIIFLVYFTGIEATDCDVYKGIIGDKYPYIDDWNKMNGNCCRMQDRLKCDAQNNIIFVDFYVMPCSVKSLFEQLANLPKLEKIEMTMPNEPIPSTIGKLTQIKKLDLRYSYGYNDRYKIPDEIGQLTNLEELKLADSNFEGKIPNSFGNLINLKRLDLNSNHLEGYVPYEFKNLKKLEYLNLSGNILKGFVPPISTLSDCNIQYNEGMCYLKSSRCRSELKECTLDEIRTTNNNNNNPKPDSGEFENEKDITLTTNGKKGSSDNDNNNDDENDYDKNNYDGNNYDENGNPKNKKNFFKTFFIVIGSGVVIIAVVLLVIYKSGKRTPKFNKFEDDKDVSVQPTTYSYNYAPASTPSAPTVPTDSTAPSTPSPVPPAAQSSTYIPPSPSVPYTGRQMVYGNPVQPPPQRSSYIPPNLNIPYGYPVQEVQTSTYAPPASTRAHALPTSTNKLKEPYQSPLPHQSPDDTLPPYQSLNHSKKRPY